MGAASGEGGRLTPVKLAINGMLKPELGVAWKSVKETGPPALMSKVRPLAGGTLADSGSTRRAE